MCRQAKGKPFIQQISTGVPSQTTLSNFFAPMAAPRYIFSIGSLLNDGVAEGEGQLEAIMSDGAFALIEMSRGEARVETEVIQVNVADADNEEGMEEFCGRHGEGVPACRAGSPGWGCAG
jgi:hypothetical protein